MKTTEEITALCDQLNHLLGIAHVDEYGLRVFDGQLGALFGEWRLFSKFVSVEELATGKSLSTESRLIVKGAHNRVIDAQIVFAVEQDPKRIILLDRMIRCLHTSNFALLHGQGAFSLDLWGKHMEALAEHHGTFQHQLMEYWALAPELLTLKIVKHNDCSAERLAVAVENYKQHGYQVGLKLDKPGIKDCLHMWRLSPDVIQLPDRFSSRMLVEEPLKRGFLALSKACHEVTRFVSLAEVSNPVQRRIAQEAGVDWIMP